MPDDGLMGTPYMSTGTPGPASALSLLTTCFFDSLAPIFYQFRCRLYGSGDTSKGGGGLMVQATGEGYYGGGFNVGPWQYGICEYGRAAPFQSLIDVQINYDPVTPLYQWRWKLASSGTWPAWTSVIGGGLGVAKAPHKGGYNPDTLCALPWAPYILWNGLGNQPANVWFDLGQVSIAGTRFTGCLDEAGWDQCAFTGQAAIISGYDQSGTTPGIGGLVCAPAGSAGTNLGNQTQQFQVARLSQPSTAFGALTRAWLPQPGAFWNQLRVMYSMGLNKAAGGYVKFHIRNNVDGSLIPDTQLGLTAGINAAGINPENLPAVAGASPGSIGSYQPNSRYVYLSLSGVPSSTAIYLDFGCMTHPSQAAQGLFSTDSMGLHPMVQGAFVSVLPGLYINPPGVLQGGAITLTGTMKQGTTVSIGTSQ